MSEITMENAYLDAVKLTRADEEDVKVNNLIQKIENLGIITHSQDEPQQDQCNSIENVANDNGITTNPTEEEISPEWLKGVFSIENKNAFEQAQYDKFVETNQKLTNELNGIYLEIETLSNNRDIALKEFDIAEIVRIDNRISQLNKEYAKKLNDGKNCKQEVESIQQEFNNKYEELDKALNNINFNDVSVTIDRKKYNNALLTNYKENKAYSMVKDFLSDYSKEEGLGILTKNPSLSKQLGKAYEKLLGEYK